MRPRPSIGDVQRAAAAAFGVPLQIMTSESIERGTAHPRQAAMALAFSLTGRSSTVVGRHFGGRDHSTVLYARDQVAVRRRQDRHLDVKLRRLEAELSQPRSFERPTELQTTFLHGPLFDLAPVPA